MNNFSEKEEKETNYMLAIFHLFEKFETCPNCQTYIKFYDHNPKILKFLPKIEFLVKKNGKIKLLAGKPGVSMDEIIRSIKAMHNHKGCFIKSALHYYQDEKARLKDGISIKEVPKMASNSFDSIMELKKERSEFKKRIGKNE